jgi:hypothetical protein
MRLIKGLPEERLHKRIHRFHQMECMGERALGFYLRELDIRQLFRKQGYASTAQYALMKLHIPLRKTRELLRIARALEHLPLIDAAFSRGRLSWSAVRELTRVTTRETEAQWLALAEKSTLRKIERAVKRVSFGEQPPRDPYGLARSKLKVVAELPVEDYAVWKEAFHRLSESAGKELDESQAVLMLARAYLERPLRNSEKESRKAFQVVYHRCSECDHAWVVGAEGPEGIPTSKVSERENDADVVHIEEDTRGSVSGEVSTPETPCVPVECRDTPNSVVIRQQVLSRDGLRCAVPGCTHRGDLVAHHVTWKSHGGRTHLLNEVCICQHCHALIHEGLLRVEGTAPHGLKWSASNGKPIEALEMRELEGRLLFEKEDRDCDPRGSLGVEREAEALMGAR